MATDEILSRIYAHLEHSLSELRKELKLVDILGSSVASIAPTLNGEENEIREFIQVNSVAGNAAVEAAANCYNDLHVQPDLSTKSTRRTVGYLWLPENDRSLRIASIVSDINQFKQNIESRITGTHKNLDGTETKDPTPYLDRNARFTALREMSKGIMPLHLYRKIICLSSGDIKSLYLNWQKKDVVLKFSKKSTFWENLVRAHDSEHTDAMEKLKLAQLIDQIEYRSRGDGHKDIRIRRTTQPQPVVSYTPIEAKMVTHSAPMPVILIQNKVPSFKMLKNFNANKTRKTRSDARKKELLGSYNGYNVEVYT